MSTDDLTDADVLALLSEDERDWFRPVNYNGPHGNCYHREHEWLRRLALARRAALDALARLECGEP